MKINLVQIITHYLDDTNSLQVTLKSDIGYPIHHYLNIVQFTMDGFVFVERFAFFSSPNSHSAGLKMGKNSAINYSNY